MSGHLNSTVIRVFFCNIPAVAENTYWKNQSDKFSTSTRKKFDVPTNVLEVCSSSSDEPNAKANPTAKKARLEQHASNKFFNNVFWIFFFRTQPAQIIANPAFYKSNVVAVRQISYPVSSIQCQIMIDRINCLQHKRHTCIINTRNPANTNATLCSRSLFCLLLVVTKHSINCRSVLLSPNSATQVMYASSIILRMPYFFSYEIISMRFTAILTILLDRKEALTSHMYFLSSCTGLFSDSNLQ